MKKPHTNGLTPLVTRQAINWRIPIDLLDRADAYRATTGQDRTSVVVQALALFLDRVQRPSRAARTIRARRAGK